MLAGLCWLVVGVIVPFYLAVIYVVLGAWGLATWIRTRRFPLALALTGGAAALIAFPAFAYNAVVFAGNPAFAVWSAQNVLTSPHPLHYVFAYAVIGLAAAFGVRAVWRRTKDDARWLLPLAWVAIVPLLVYLPINIQRRLSEAVIVPLAVLAVVGLQKLSSPSDPFSLSERGRTPRLPIVFLAVVSLSAAFLWLGGMVTALSPRAPAFIPAAYAAAFAWLNAPDGANVQPDDVILASVPMGNALPAYMRARVYMGHGPETLFWGAKTDIVERFYGGDLSDVELSALFVPPCPAPDDAATGRGLCLLPVRYVVYGDMERALEITPMPNDAMPAWADGLTRVYDLDGVQIYAAD